MTSLKRSKTKTIVFQAESFGFGPSSIAISIAKCLKQILTTQFKYIFVGCGVSSELGRLTDVFDKVISTSDLCEEDVKLDPSQLDEVCYFVSIVSPSGAKFSLKQGWQTGYVDPLFWFFNHLDPALKNVDHYFVQKFMSTKDDCERFDLDQRKITEVDWIRTPIASKKELRRQTRLFCQNEMDRSIFQSLLTSENSDSYPLVVSLGGVNSFLKNNSTYPIEILEIIVPIVEQKYPDKKIMVLGGGDSLKQSAKKFQSIIWSGAVTPEWAGYLTSRAFKFFFTPGLSTLIEVLTLRSDVSFFLPPQNYSQYLQIEHFRSAYSNRFNGFNYTDNKIDKLPPFLPENEGVEKVNEFWNSFLKSNSEIDQFKEKLYFHLENEIAVNNSINLTCNGANSIAHEIIKNLWTQNTAYPPFTSLRDNETHLFRSIYKANPSDFFNQMASEFNYVGPRIKDKPLLGSYLPVWINQPKENARPDQILAVSGGPCLCWCEGKINQLSLEDIMDLLMPIFAAKAWGAQLFIVLTVYESVIQEKQPVNGPYHQEYKRLAQVIERFIFSIARIIGLPNNQIHIINTDSAHAMKSLSNLSETYFNHYLKAEQITDLYNFNSEKLKQRVPDTTIDLTAVYIRNIAMYTAQFFSETIGEPLQNIIIVENTTQIKAIQKGIRFSTRLNPDQKMYHFSYLAAPGTTGIEMCRSPKFGIISLGDTTQEIKFKIDSIQKQYVKSYFNSSILQYGSNIIDSVWPEEAIEHNILNLFLACKHIIDACIQNGAEI